MVDNALSGNSNDGRCYVQPSRDDWVLFGAMLWRWRWRPLRSGLRYTGRTAMLCAVPRQIQCGPVSHLTTSLTSKRLYGSVDDTLKFSQTPLRRSAPRPAPSARVTGSTALWYCVQATLAASASVGENAAMGHASCKRMAQASAVSRLPPAAACCVVHIAG